MNTHDLNLEKLNLIGWIYNLQDISLLNNLKELQKNY